MQNNDLNNISKNNAFKVPEDYFEKLNIEVLSQLYKNKNKLTFWKKNSKWLVAASISIVISIGVWINSSSKTTPINYANITEEEYIDFEENNELTDEELSEIINTEALDSIYKTEIITASYIEDESISPSDTLTEYSLFEDEIQI